MSLFPGYRNKLRCGSECRGQRGVPCLVKVVPTEDILGTSELEPTVKQPEDGSRSRLD